MYNNLYNNLTYVIFLSYFDWILTSIIIMIKIKSNIIKISIFNLSSINCAKIKWNLFKY